MTMSIIITRSTKLSQIVYFLAFLISLNFLKGNGKISISQQNHLQSINPTPPNCDNLYLKKDIGDIVVVENEILTLDLNEYISGQLLTYKLDVTHNQGHIDIDNIIYVNEPYTIVSQANINNTKPGYQTSFLRSTLFIENFFDEYICQQIFFVDKNFIFRYYNTTSYTIGQIDQVFEYQLNTSIINGSCSDLINIDISTQNFYTFLLFCKSYSNNNGPYNQNIQIMVIIFIGDKGKISTKYIIYQEQDQFKIDFEKGLRYLEYRKDYYRDFSKIELVANTLIKKESNSTYITYSSILSINFTQYEGVLENSVKIVNESVFQLQCQIYYEKDYFDEYMMESTDFIVIEPQNFVIAYIQLSDGLYIVSALDSSQPEYQNNKINGKLINACGKGNVSSFYNVDPQMSSLYLNSKMPNYLYATVSLPPGVIEFDITDYNKPTIFKIYLSYSLNNNFIGLPIMEVSNRYILHLMLDIINQKRFIRIYSRELPQISLAQFDILIPMESNPNFFIFPNIYLDNIWFKDEQVINIMSLRKKNLIFNATNENSINRYINIPLQAIIKVQDLNNCQKEIQINVIIINKQNTTIWSRNSAQSLYYSCGDIQFKYSLDNLFNGPYPNMQYQNNKYFNINGQKVKNQHTQILNNNICAKTFIVENKIGDQNTARPKSSNQIMVICINTNNSTITAFSITKKQNITQFINQISFPQINITGAIYDTNQNMIMVLGTQNSYQDNDDDNKYEVHFIKINSIMTWIKTQSGIVIGDIMDEKIIYNSNLGQGVSVRKAVSTSNFIYQDICIYIYDVNETSMAESNCMTVVLKSMLDSVIKAEWYNKQFFYSLNKNSELVIHDYSEGIDFVPYQNMYAKKGLHLYCNKAHYFTIVNDIYFVLFCDQNGIIVYEIDNYINLIFKMQLPLYNYENFTFSIKQSNYSDNSTQTVHSSIDNILIVILFQKSDHLDSQSEQTIALFYDVSTNKHNSLRMICNITEIVINPSEQTIQIKSIYDYNKYLMVLFNGTHQLFYHIDLSNEVELNKSSDSQMQLQQICSQLIPKANIDGILVSWPQIIEQISLQTISNIDLVVMKKLKPQIINDNNINYKSQNKPQNPVLLTLFSQNYGGSLIAIPSDTMNNITYSMLEGVNIQIQDYIQGSGIYLSTSCSYINNQNELVQCNENNINQIDVLINGQTYIDFTTQDKNVHKMILLDEFYLIFDSQSQLYIYKIRDKQNGFQENIQILSREQYEIFNCKLDGFINHIKLESNELDPTLSEWLLVYQCMDDQTYKSQLRFSQVTIKQQLAQQLTSELQNSEQNGDDLFKFTNFISAIDMPYKVTSAEFSNIIIKKELSDHQIYLEIYSQLIVVVKNQGSFSNVVFIFSIRLEHSLNDEVLLMAQLTYELTGYLSASSLQCEEFYAISVQIMHNPSIAIITVKNQGILFVDLNTHQPIHQIYLLEYENFRHQYQSEVGDFYVYGTNLHLPNKIHALTNYGVFKMTFGVDLNSREEILRNNQTLVPTEIFIIRHQQSVQKYEIKTNSQGYAYIYTDLQAQPANNKKIRVISYLQSVLSSVVAIISLDGYQQCSNLIMREPSGNINDPIKLSLVCDSILLTYQVPQYTTISIDFNNITDMPLSMSYNQFDIMITAVNELSMTKSEIVVQFLPIRIISGQKLFLAVIIFLIAAVYCLIILLKNAQQQKVVERNQQEKANNQLLTLEQSEQSSVIVNNERFTQKKRNQQIMTEQNDYNAIPSSGQSTIHQNIQNPNYNKHKYKINDISLTNSLLTVQPNNESGYQDDEFFKKSSIDETNDPQKQDDINEIIEHENQQKSKKRFTSGSLGDKTARFSYADI